jgi:myo-inositol-1(or 4)-monophosphatase
MTDHQRLLGIAHEAVDHAVKLFNAGSHHQLTAKGDRDYATETDYRIEHELRDRLAEATPEIGFLGEETGHTGSRERWWCLDPIDGTVNYVHGNPLCGVSLALVEDDEPTIGIIDLPRLGHRYWATDAGAFRDGEQIEASTPGRLADAIISLGDFAVGPDAEARNEIRVDVLAGLVGRVLRLRMVGSAATDLAWVADGKLDGTIIIGSHSWDLAAGTVIAKRAGATVQALSLAGSHVTIGGSPQVVDEVTRALDSVGALG